MAYRQAVRLPCKQPVGGEERADLRCRGQCGPQRCRKETQDGHSCPSIMAPTGKSGQITLGDSAPHLTRMTHEHVGQASEPVVHNPRRRSLGAQMCTWRDSNEKPKCPDTQWQKRSLLSGGCVPASSGALVHFGHLDFGFRICFVFVSCFGFRVFPRGASVAQPPHGHLVRQNSHSCDIHGVQVRAAPERPRDLSAGPHWRPSCASRRSACIFSFCPMRALRTASVSTKMLRS